MAVVRDLVRSVQPLVDFVYPPRCAACGVALAAQDGLCSECWATLEVPPLAEGGVVAIYAATYYNDTSRRLVLAYKHGGRIALSRLLARLIAARMPEPAPGRPPPLLVPVPLHRWRLWQRGFNQAALLARELERFGKGRAEVAALVRHRRTPNLGGLGRDDRERVLRGAIRLDPAHAARLAGRNVVLVDDVLTSGATSRACIAAIAGARPASIALACFARVDAEHRLEHV
ncbi:ComF family protein [Erythrobacter sp. NE805]|uniref:ComF family protein n=1 Tax=Erythrobacter sp. NE805 TaxID=3389875 RepID=UPI00396B0102